MFGLNPEKEHRLCDHVRKVLSNDGDILQYREEPVLHHLERRIVPFFFYDQDSVFYKVIQMNELRFKWQERNETQYIIHALYGLPTSFYFL